MGWAVSEGYAKAEMQNNGPPSCPELLGSIVASLFPDQSETVRTINVSINQHFDEPLILEVKLIRAYN